jgi:hypothetical protein
MHDEAHFKIYCEITFKLSSIVSRPLRFTQLYSGHGSFINLLIKRAGRDEIYKVRRIRNRCDQLEI